MPGHIFPKPEAGPVSLYYWDGAAWQKWLGNPLTIGSQLYYWDGAAWQKWQGNPTSIGSQGYVWDGSAWRKMSGDAAGHVQVDVLSQPSPTTVQQTTPANLTPGIHAWQGASWQKVRAWASGALAHRRTSPACTSVVGINNVSLISGGATVYWASVSNNLAAAQFLYLRNNGAAGNVVWQVVVAGNIFVHCLFDPPIHFGINCWFMADNPNTATITVGYDLD